MKKELNTIHTTPIFTDPMTITAQNMNPDIAQHVQNL